QLRVDYPIAVDSGYAIWNAFNNAYWPAIYIVDAKGQIRYHHFGEGEYQRTERVIQQLLGEAGASGIGTELVSADARGPEVAADWSNLKWGENYVGYPKAEGFTSPGGAAHDKPRVYAAPGQLKLNQWALAGEWSVGKETATAEKPKARIAYRF